MSNKNYINYVVAIDSDDVDTNFKIKEYNTYISYRKYIRKWLYYDLIPSIKWQKSDNYKEEYGIKLRLGLLISK